MIVIVDCVCLVDCVDVVALWRDVMMCRLWRDVLFCGFCNFGISGFCGFCGFCGLNGFRGFCRTWYEKRKVIIARWKYATKKVYIIIINILFIIYMYRYNYILLFIFVFSKIFFHFCLFFVLFFRGFFGKNFWTLKKWNKFPYSYQNSFYFLIACENFHTKSPNPQNHEIAKSPFYNVIVQLSINSDL